MAKNPEELEIHFENAVKHTEPEKGIVTYSKQFPDLAAPITVTLQNKDGEKLIFTCEKLIERYGANMFIVDGFTCKDAVGYEKFDSKGQVVIDFDFNRLVLHDGKEINLDILRQKNNEVTIKTNGGYSTERTNKGVLIYKQLDEGAKISLADGKISFECTKMVFNPETNVAIVNNLQIKGIGGTINTERAEIHLRSENNKDPYIKFDSKHDLKITIEEKTSLYREERKVPLWLLMKIPSNPKEINLEEQKKPITLPPNSTSAGSTTPLYEIRPSPGVVVSTYTPDGAHLEGCSFKGVKYTVYAPKGPK